MTALQQPTGDAAQAMAFLRGLFPEGPWVVVHDLESEGAPRGRWPAASFVPGQELQLAAAIERHLGRNNLYFVVNLPGPTVRLSTSPSEDEMSAYRAIPLDVDLPADASEADRDDVVASIAAATPPPTAIIFSGGGIQAFWVFATHVPLARQPDYERAVLYFADRFGGDHVQNVNRLMRLPGTVNVLNAKKREAGRSPAAAYVIDADYDRTISLDDPVEAPRTPAARYSVAELPETWRTRVTSGSTDWLRGRDHTASAAVFGVVCELVRQEWPDDAIVALLTDQTHGISRHVLAQPRPADYAARQARDARAKVARDFVRTEKGAVVADSYENVKKGFLALNTTLSYDSFADRILYVNGDARPLLFGDGELRDYRVRKFAEDLRFRPSKEYFADAVSSIAAERSYHPVCDYLASLTWDDQPRIDAWLVDLAGAPDTPYVRAVSRLILLGAVARVRTPGVKFDEMLVFESPQQGTFKSSALHVLAVREEWFADGLSLAAGPQQVIEQLGGKWIVESSDLSGMRKSEVENLKAFLSRQADRARMAYGRFPVERPRGCVFFGTTNSTRYLRDETNRRFWPVRITRSFDVAELARVRDQLWAEAAATHASGASVRLEPHLYDAATAEQSLRRIEDPWIEILEVAFGTQTGRVLTTDAFEVVGRPDGQRLQEDNRRVGEAMRELGWERVRTSGRGDGVAWYYLRGSAAERRRDLYLLRGDFGAPARDPATGRVRILDAAQLADRGIHVDPPPPAHAPPDPALSDPDDVPFP